MPQQNTKGLTPGLVDRIKNKVKEFWDGRSDEAEATPQEDPLLIGPGVDAPIIMYRIRAAAARQVLLYMKYNGEWRHVEPYSWRRRQAVGNTPLLMGFCYLHSTIEAYKVDKIEDVQVTDRPFKPKWPIEI